MAAELNVGQVLTEQNPETQVVDPEGTISSGVPPTLNEDDPGPYYVKLRGIPYETTPGEVLEFLGDCKVKGGEGGIHVLQAPDNRPKGEALVELETNQDMVSALNKDRQHMGNRYVEVMFVNKDQYEAELTRQPGTANSGDYVVRLRGLPYSAQTKDLLQFLSDCTVSNGEAGVHFTFVPDGRPSGEAFVELQSEEDVSKALAHHNEHMGRRYVEMFRASRGQMEWECRKVYDDGEGVGGASGGGEGSFGGGTGGTGSGGVVRLRGLPYGCAEEEVRRFFSGLNVVPGGIVLQRDSNGGETGEGFVEFMTKEDAEKALDRNRQKIQHRYIEVFRSSHAEVRPVKSTSRPTPYSRPGGRGGFAGYGGYGSKYGSGYERGYNRGRGRGPPQGHFHPPYDTYGGPGGYYEEPDYYHHGPPDAGGYPPHGPPHMGGPPAPQGGNGNLVGYPPIRPSNRGGYGGPQGTGGGGAPPRTKHMVRLRGLPYSAQEKDITDFFQPLTPIRVIMDFDQFGRPSGEAEVYFQSHDDAQAAMKKNNQHIGPRYIELFLHSTEDAGGPQGGGGAAGGMKYGQQPQAQQGWGDNRVQGRPMDQAPQGIGGMPPAPTAGYAQQRVQAPAATQYGGPTASAGYPQQQPQQQYQQQTQGYVGYTDQQTGGYQQSAPQYHDTAGYGQPQQQPHVHQQQWGTY